MQSRPWGCAKLWKNFGNLHGRLLGWVGILIPISLLKSSFESDTSKREPKSMYNPNDYYPSGEPKPKREPSLIREELGSKNPNFTDELFHQIADTIPHDDQYKSRKLEFLTSVLEEFPQKDHLTGMLLAQMATCHSAIMQLASQFSNARTLPELEIIERMLTKMMRTYTSQFEALRRHQRGPDQTVNVENLSVTDGSQAIVGHVSHQGGAATTKNAATKPAALRHDSPPTMPMIDEMRATRSKVKLKNGKPSQA